MSEWETTPAERLSAYAQRWERIAAERGTRMDELQARAEAAEARCAAMEECDCIPAEFSSKACSKCGRRGVVTETTVRSLMIEIRDEKARCARLQQALETIERDFPGDDDNWRWVTTLCREALAGPDTPADSPEARDVLALVAVARAARPALELLAAEGYDANRFTGAPVCAEYDRLAEALARLDGAR